MKTFIVLQKIVLFRVDWRNLYDPDHYRLVLVVHEPTLQSLSEEQRACFTEIYCIKEFTSSAVQAIVQKTIDSSSGEVRLITNDELCIELAANLRQYFNLPGDRAEVIRRFVNKAETKKVLKDKEINLPKYCLYEPNQYKQQPDYYINELQAKLAMPIFVKPVDSAASQGTAKVNNIAELCQWCNEHKEDTNYEFDEFLTGTLYHCESIVRNNEVLFAAVGENAHPCFDFMSGKVTATIVLPENDELAKEMLAFNENVLKVLKPIPDGVTHLEFFRRPNGEFVFLEIACRAPGGMIVQMHQKYYGINFEQANFAMQMGLNFDVTVQRGPYCAWAWFPSQKGKIKAFKNFSIKSAHEVMWRASIGQIYNDPASLVDVVGGIILWNNDYRVLRQDFDYLAGLDQFVETEFGDC